MHVPDLNPHGKRGAPGPFIPLASQAPPLDIAARLQRLRLAHAEVDPRLPPPEHIRFGHWVEPLWYWRCTSKLCQGSNDFCAGFRTRELAANDAHWHNRIFHDRQLTVWEQLESPPSAGPQLGST